MSGGFNPVNMVSQVALAAVTGGASIVSQIAMQVVAQIAKEVLTQVGEQLGLPPAATDALGQAFDAGFSGGGIGAAGGALAGLSALQMLQTIAQQGGASPVETAQFEQSADPVRDALNDLITSGADENTKRIGGGGQGKQGWLMAIAEALGKQLNEMAADMDAMAANITKDTPDLTTKFSAASQEFGILFNAASTAIKSIGEGMAQGARKS